MRDPLLLATLVAGLFSVSPAAAGAVPDACAALARRVAATPGDDALLLRSYDEAAAGAQALTPALEKQPLSTTTRWQPSHSWPAANGPPRNA